MTFHEHKLHVIISSLCFTSGCPVNFEFQNYTIITSQCKGPHYSQNACCTAFKEFACPFADELNDVSNDCASTMFSYINLNGRYPPGLFASFCREGKEGLACPASGPLAADTNANAGQKLQNLSALLIILAAGFMLFHIFWDCLCLCLFECVVVTFKPSCSAH